MVGYFWRHLRARLRASRALDALAVLGVALGVASVLSIQILNRNALGAFRGSVRAISGEVDLTVVGRMPSFPEELLRRVGYFGPAAGAAAAFRRLAEGLDTAIVRVVAVRPGTAAVRAVIEACMPALVAA